jgi:hypothetical protein
MAKRLQAKTRPPSAGSRLPWVEQTDALPRTLAHADVSEFRLGKLMQSSGSPFVISNAAMFTKLPL